MIAFDFVILAVIALSGNLKDSVWKCSQIITIIQKEGKIVFLPVQMESTIKNTSEPPSPFLCWARSCPASRNPLQLLRGQPGDSPAARPCWSVLGGISLSATATCSGRRGDEDPEPHPVHADPPTIGNGHQGLMWRGRGRRSRREGKASTCLAFVHHVARGGCLWLVLILPGAVSYREAELAEVFPSLAEAASLRRGEVSLLAPVSSRQLSLAPAVTETFLHELLSPLPRRLVEGRLRG